MRFFWHSFVRETYSLSAMVYVKPFMRLEFVEKMNANTCGPSARRSKEYVYVYITDKKCARIVFLCLIDDD